MLAFCFDNSKKLKLTFDCCGPYLLNKLHTALITVIVTHIKAKNLWTTLKKTFYFEQI